jgi:hypothetical protein
MRKIEFPENRYVVVSRFCLHEGEVNFFCCAAERLDISAAALVAVILCVRKQIRQCVEKSRPERTNAFQRRDSSSENVLA